MNNQPLVISLEKNPLISIEAVPGHFATSNSHLNYYLNVGEIKSNALIAKDVARELAIPYLASTMVDTIVCMEKTAVLGAYLADELLHHGVMSINGDSEGEIHVVMPINSVDGKLIFLSNMQEYILNKNIILLLASSSSGRTLDSALECLTYYGGNVCGISILFCAYPEKMGKEAHALFTAADIPDYKVCNPDECSMCKENQQLDAMISSEGYTKIPTQ